MVIDAHLHIGLNNWTESSLLNYLDEKGIEKAWILTWDEYKPLVPMYYQSLDIDLVRKAFKNSPDRIVPFYAPDPARPDWKKRLSNCLNDGFAGCGELKVPYNWNDERIIPLLEFLNHNKLPLIFHMERGRNIFVPKRDRGADWLFKRLINERFNGRSAHLIEQLKNGTGFLKRYLDNRMVRFPGYLLDFNTLEEVITRYRSIRFIAHGPHIWNHFSSPEKEYLFHQKGMTSGKGIIWRLLESHDNLFCDISGFSGFIALNRDHIFTREFLSSLHKKVLFGTDNGDHGLQEFIAGLGLDKEKLENIYYRNAQAIAGK
ncbi:MAG: hypothetical protein WD577_03280 [Bacteroidales bacterium]